MITGRKAHYEPRVKDVYKQEVSFSLVPSNLGKRGKVCSYSARLAHNQVLDERSSSMMFHGWTFVLTAQLHPDPIRLSFGA